MPKSTSLSVAESNPFFRGQPEIASVRPFAKRGAQKSLNRGGPVRPGNWGGKGLTLWISAHTQSAFCTDRRGATGIKRRIGYNRPWFNRLAYTETVDRRFNELEEIERLMELVRPLGIVMDPRPKPGWCFPKRRVRRRTGSGAAKNFDRPVLGIHPGSTWPTKCWPVEYFSEIVSRASSEGAHVLVFAGPGEEAVAARVLAEAQGDSRNVTNLAGQLRLPEFGGVPRQAGLLSDQRFRSHASGLDPGHAAGGPVRSHGQVAGLFPARGECEWSWRPTWIAVPAVCTVPRSCPKGTLPMHEGSHPGSGMG